MNNSGTVYRNWDASINDYRTRIIIDTSDTLNMAQNPILGVMPNPPGGVQADPFFDPSAHRVNPGAISTDNQRMAQLEMRLRMTFHELRTKLLGLGTTYEEGKVYVHFVRAGALQVFTDEPAMFPSDALVNNLRLCL